MARNRFERLRKIVRFTFVVTGKYPYLTVAFHPDLRGPWNMSGRKKSKLYPIDGNRFSVGYGLDVVAQGKAVLDNRGRTLRAKVRRVSSSRMIGMSVGNDRPGHGLPGIQVDIRHGA